MFPLPLAGDGQGEGRSLVLELRLALFHERRHALLLVFGREQRVEQPPLEEHPFGERRLEGAVDRFLRHHHRGQRELGDLRRGGERLLDQLVGRHHARNQPRALALGRLRVIMPTRPRVSTMMFSYAIGVDFREEPQGEAPDFIRPPSPCPLPQAGEGMMFSRKEAVMIDPRTASLGALLLRLSLGAMFIAHASFKYFVFTLPGTAQFFASVGFPRPLAYVVFAAELIGGAMLVLGVYARWVALAFVPLLLGATTVHWGNGWPFDSKGGGWEFPVFWAVVLVVQSMIGDGALALKRSSSATEPEPEPEPEPEASA